VFAVLHAGALCLFAYLYMRPFVRRGLGSAGRCAVLVPASNVCVCVGGSVGKCDVTLCGT
jgi:hypothetical protein